MFYVLEGDHVFVCGDEEFQLGPGGLVFLPRGIPHAHRRLEPGSGRLLSIMTPAGFEGFFRILAEAAGSGGPMDEAYVRASREYGHHLVGLTTPGLSLKPPSGTARCAARGPDAPLGRPRFAAAERRVGEWPYSRGPMRISVPSGR